MHVEQEAMSKVASSTEFGRHHVPPVLILHCTADQMFCLCTNDYAKSEPACCPGAGVDWPEWPHVLGTLSIGMILQSFLPFLAMAIGQFFTGFEFKAHSYEPARHCH